MENLQSFIAEIVQRIRTIYPERIVLFGSCAQGNPSPESDVDLLVVTNSDLLPRTFREKSDLYLQVAGLISDISQKIPVDLIVHTRKMHQKFIELDSGFSREISRNGKVLYEAHHPGMGTRCTG